MNKDEFYEYEDRAEEWRDVSGYEGLYQVSNLGRLKRLSLDMEYSNGQRHHYPERIYEPTVAAGNGYYVARIRKPLEKARTVPYHRLVAEAFLPNPKGYEMVNHKDGDRTNNTVDNLEWCDAWYNAVDSVYRNNGVGFITLKGVRCVETGIEYASASLAARALSNSPNTKATAGNIWAAAKGMRPTAIGFHWEFIGESENE